VSIGAGGLFSAGNARTIAMTTLGNLRLRRDEHQLSIALAANFARAAAKRVRRILPTLGTYRFIADVGLKSNIADRLALATTYTARYENKPLRNVASLDSIASINLVYSLF
jgi:hypothetical protein